MFRRIISPEMEWAVPEREPPFYMPYLSFHSNKKQFGYAGLRQIISPHFSLPAFWLD